MNTKMDMSTFVLSTFATALPKMDIFSEGGQVFLLGLLAGFLQPRNRPDVVDGSRLTLSCRRRDDQ